MPPSPTFFERPFVSAALLLSVAIVVSFGSVAYALYASRTAENTITTTGSAKTSIKADSAKWTSVVSRTVQEGSIPSAYTQVEADMKTVRAYLKNAGISDEQVSVTPVSVNQDYYGSPDQVRRYMVMQSVTVESTDVEKIQTLAEGIGVLIQRGVMINPGQPQYFVTKLPELRVSLLGEAVKDAKARADELAKAGGSTVGPIKSSSSGVVQVLSPNSIDVSDYGTYDTMTIDKEVMVTVRATFSVR